jgi:hypothetical protein
MCTRAAASVGANLASSSTAPIVRRCFRGVVGVGVGVVVGSDGGVVVGVGGVVVAGAGAVEVLGAVVGAVTTVCPTVVVTVCVRVVGCVERECPQPASTITARKSRAGRARMAVM